MKIQEVTDDENQSKWFIHNKKSLKYGLVVPP